MSIDLSKNDGIATITFDRPEKLNALTLRMYEQLEEAFLAVRNDDDVRVIILTGSGPRAFCVGADLKESIPALAEGRFDISHWDGAHLKNIGLYKPIISAINGLCMGGGFEIMLATDIRIAAQGALFALPEATHGFVPAGGTLVRLVRQIGYAHAMEILLTGAQFTAEEMAVKGVVNRVVHPDDLMSSARTLAQRIASFSPLAVQTIKEGVLSLQDLSFEQAFAEEAQLGQRTFASEGAKKGLASFAARS